MSSERLDEESLSSKSEVLELDLLAATDHALEEPVDDFSTDGSVHIPFSYASEHGLFFDDEKGILFVREDIHTHILSEFYRRFHITPEVKRLSTERFGERVEESYAKLSGRTAAAAEETLASAGTDGLNALNALAEAEDLLADSDDAPIIRFLNAIFFEAVQEGASDIHIEPYEDSLVVRFRLDGALQERITTKSTLTSLLISRVKVMARLDIAEKRVPQDGRIMLRLGARKVDLRVSTMPTAYGERVVMRLLDKKQSRLNLEVLGMPSATLDIFRAAVGSPNGIVLVTGPTGSGKTTTLYGAMGELDKAAQNIMTVEDPLEYYMHGISQTQINQRAGLTFARGLRAILRQDPDIVMIGEIRDGETAQIAVQASLTGHLVLSTLHTNSAVGAVTRLKDMGVEPYLLASSLQAMLAQRLLRRLCPHCKESHKPTNADLDLLHAHLPDAKVGILYEAKGCKKCHGLGFSGRQGVFEMVRVDDGLRSLITMGASEQDMANHAFENGSVSLAQAAFSTVLSGVTSLKEAIRTTLVL